MVEIDRSPKNESTKMKKGVQPPLSGGTISSFPGLLLIPKLINLRREHKGRQRDMRKIKR